MYHIVMVFATCLFQPPIDREVFSMVKGAEAPLPNRILNDEKLKTKISNEANRVLKIYKGNTDKVRVTLTLRKMQDWLDKLPDIKDGLNDVEKTTINDIINSELLKITELEQQKVLSTPMTKSKPKSSTPEKTLSWCTYAGYNILVYGWTDPITGQKRFLLEDQVPEVQAILRAYPPY